MKVLLLVLLLFWPAAAEDVQASLSQAYSRAERAARFKFVEGLLSSRAAGFQLFGPDGSRRDLTLERERFDSLFSNALGVRLHTKIVRVVVIRGGAQAEVDQNLQVEQVERASKRRFTVVLRTRAIDQWVRGPLGWKLLATRVLSQTMGTESP